MGNAAGSAESFARRVRDLMDERKYTVAELADRAELAPSLVSKLLTDTDAARREPRLEHVFAIARALEVQPLALVAGTSTHALLSGWVPRQELSQEAKTRCEAQADAARLRTELAESRAEAKALREIRDQLSNEVATLRHEVAKHRVEKVALAASRGAALVERDAALADAQNARSWYTNAVSRLRQLQEQVQAARLTQSMGWIVAGISAAVAVAASEPAPRKASTSRRRTGRS